MSRYRALAPAKVNLGLFVGPPRTGDGKHEIVTVMQSVSLADEVTLEPAPDGVLADEVDCPGVPGRPQDNLAAAALAAFRAATGWAAPPLRLTILKRIPLAAGLGGGSADAAAALRLASHASGLGDERLLHELASGLGADVPAQILPGRWLATGAGELLDRLPDPEATLELLVVPLAATLASGDVYREADRLGVTRPPGSLADRRRELHAALEHGEPAPAAGELLVNDLQPAAISLCPQIAGVIEEVRAAGAEHVLVSGSGPTVVGLFSSPERVGHASRAAESLRERTPPPLLAHPVGAEFARAVELSY